MNTKSNQEAIELINSWLNEDVPGMDEAFEELARRRGWIRWAYHGKDKGRVINIDTTCPQCGDIGLIVHAQVRGPVVFYFDKNGYADWVDETRERFTYGVVRCEECGFIRRDLTVRDLGYGPWIERKEERG